MEKILINRLPMLTYRHLHTNETEIAFPQQAKTADAVFSSLALVRPGGSLPDTFQGASRETREAAAAGPACRIDIPNGTEQELTITVALKEDRPDYAGVFLFRLGKKARLNLTWKWTGTGKPGRCCTASFYEVGEEAVLRVSKIQTGMENTFLCDQRECRIAGGGQADFVSAELGGGDTIVHSRGELDGDHSVMKESLCYAGTGRQRLDLFYHITHHGKESESLIDVRGSLAGQSRKIFRGTIDFKRGCSGAEGTEGDYAVQLDPGAKNISLPLLLCTEDNVVGNHASSAGQLDREKMYYLMSRGLSPEEARRIAVESLVRPVIDRLEPSLQEEALQDIRTKLNHKGE